ncbi:hypothetical protein [Wenyingzhuangia sp. IMCC45574]
MNKLQKYNQRLLAILGTLVVLGLTILIISGTYFIISDIFTTRNNREITDNSLTINTIQRDSVQSKKIINQKITLEKPKLIDTLKTIYLIPVSQVNIENKKNGNYNEPKLISGGRYKTYKSRNYYYRYSGEYNNLIVYNEQKNTKINVFNQKIFVSEFTNRMINSRHYIFLTGTSKDSNNDNKLNDIDLKSLFVYDIDKETLKEFGYNDLSFESYYIQNESSKVILRYSVDDNMNGEINHLQEPVIMKELNLETFRIDSFIEKNQIEKLNKLIN